MLSRLVRGNGLLLFGAVCGGLVCRAAALVVPFVVGQTVDRGVQTGRGAVVLWGGLSLLLLGAVEWGGAVTRHRTESKMYMVGMGTLRESAVAAALEADDRARSRYLPGDVVARATGDAKTTADLLHDAGQVSAELMSVLVILAVLTFVDPALALLVGVMGVAGSLVTWASSAAWQSRFVVARNAASATTEAAQEAIEGFEVFRGLGVEGAPIDRFAARSRAWRVRSVAVARLWLVFDPLLAVLSALLVAAVLWIGGQRAIDGAASLGDVVTALGLALLLVGPARLVGEHVFTLRAARASAGRLAALLGSACPTRARGSGPRGARAGPTLEIAGLRYERPGNTEPLLDGVNLQAEGGELVRVLGTTGSGTSVLFAILCGRLRPSAGVIRLDGTAVADWPADELRRRILLCDAAPFLFAGSVADNLRFAAPGATREEMAGAAHAVQASEFIGRLPGGFDAGVGERGTNLSGGQRQCLALARAVLARPRMLILDGATSALDPRRERAAIEGLRASLPATVLLVVTGLETLTTDQTLTLDDRRPVRP